MAMKIGMISLYLPSDSKIGAGYQAHYMANALAKRGHQVVMFSPAGRPEDALYDHRWMGLAGACRTFRFAWNLRGVDWSGFDVIHAHGDDYWLWKRGRPVHVRTMHGSCLAEAIHVRGVKERTRMVMLGASEVLATCAADATVGVSANTCRYFPWVKRMIGNGVDMGAFYPGEKEKEPTILFVGTYRNRKRGKLLMEVFAENVRPAIPTAKLWMVCSDAPVAEGVEVLGRLTTEELAERYRRAWVFCLPSTYEGFGVPYIEAMASGTAVLATPNVGAREVLGEGQFGKIVESDDLGKALIELLRSPDLRAGMVQLGFARARDFGWDRIAGQYEQLYAELQMRAETSRLRQSEQ